MKTIRFKPALAHQGIRVRRHLELDLDLVTVVRRQIQGDGYKCSADGVQQRRANPVGAGDHVGSRRPGRLVVNDLDLRDVSRPWGL